MNCIAVHIAASPLLYMAGAMCFPPDSGHGPVRGTAVFWSKVNTFKVLRESFLCIS